MDVVIFMDGILTEARESRSRFPESPLLLCTHRGHRRERVMADMPSRKRPERRRPSEHIWDLEEEDRRHIALKLRESTSQELVALKMNLGVIKQSDARLGPTASQARAECVTLADESAHEIYAFSHSLDPPL